MTRYSILDQVPLYAGLSSEETLENLTAFAQAADANGYTRIWFAEHHNSRGFISSAPDIMAAHVLARTERIRVGTGGVMAMNYGSLQIAERFNLLASLYPDRVDLGLGRAPGTDMLAAAALNQGRTIGVPEINDIILETAAFIRGDVPKDSPYAMLHAFPTPGTAPQLWMLGSSGSSATWAAHHGFNYAYAQFFSGSQDEHLMDAYRSQLPEGVNGTNLSAVSVMAADTEEEAQHYALSALNFRYRLARGLPVQFKHPDEIASDEEYAARLRTMLIGNRHMFVGTYDDVAQRLEDFARETATDELMMVTYCADNEAKIRSITELSKRLIA